MRRRFQKDLTNRARSSDAEDGLPRPSTLLVTGWEAHPTGWPRPGLSHGNSVSLVLTAIALLVTAAVWLPCGGAVAQEIPNPDLIFQPPDETLLFGREVPDIGLRHADGTRGRLSDLWAERPVFVTLVFSRCAGICSPYLGLLKKTVEQVGYAGEGYQMVVISFDPRDGAKDMLALAKHHGLESDRGWTFATAASTEELNGLCQSLDFDFRWDEERQQYNHPAITVALRAGKFARISVGEEVSPGRFKEMLADARGEFVPIYPVPGKRGALFRCFDYDPKRGFTPNWGMLLLIFPGAAALTLAAVLFAAARFRRAPARAAVNRDDEQTLFDERPLIPDAAR